MKTRLMLLTFAFMLPMMAQEQTKMKITWGHLKQSPLSNYIFAKTFKPMVMGMVLYPESDGYELTLTYKTEEGKTETVTKNFWRTGQLATAILFVFPLPETCTALTVHGEGIRREGKAIYSDTPTPTQ